MLRANALKLMVLAGIVIAILFCVFVSGVVDMLDTLITAITRS